jgi:cystathionine beta-lyase
MYNFDKIINRRGTMSVKWDNLKNLYGRGDLLPLWVADMDFEAPPEVIRALMERAEHGVYGYTFISDEYYDAVIGWMKRRHNWQIEREWITFTPGVIPALSYAIRAFTQPGDKIIVQTPVYHPFYHAIEANERLIVKNPLIYKDGKYHMDFDHLERNIDDRVKMLILCSPHNPVGRVWTKEELRKLADICFKYDILVVSDEIHFDIVYKGHEHTVFANLSYEASQNCVVLTAPSKTFNLAGLQVSNAIIPNELLRLKFRNELNKDHILSPNVFGERALIAAYNRSEGWLEALLEYLEENRDFFIEYMEKNIPKLKPVKPEGTYLVWVDCTELGMNPKQLRDFFVNKCKLALNDGQMFGEEGSLFQRFNIGCPRSILEEALYRIEIAVNNL